MKTQTKERVHRFMKAIDTTHMNSNTFIFSFFAFIYTGDPMSQLSISRESFKKAPSVESVTRSRRFWIQKDKELKREDADTEESYIDEFSPLRP